MIWLVGFESLSWRSEYKVRHVHVHNSIREGGWKTYPIP